MMNYQDKDLSMIDIDDSNKRLILHSAYYAYELEIWGRALLNKVNQEDHDSFPAGDPVNNLFNLASRLLSDFDGDAAVDDNLERIKNFIYSTSK